MTNILKMPNCPFGVGDVVGPREHCNWEKGDAQLRLLVIAPDRLIVLVPPSNSVPHSIYHPEASPEEVGNVVLSNHPLIWEKKGHLT